MIANKGQRRCDGHERWASLPLLLLFALAAAAPLTVIYTLSPLHNLARTLVFNLAEVALLFGVVYTLSRDAQLVFRVGDGIFALYFIWCSAIVLWHWLNSPELVDMTGRSATTFTRAVLTLEVFWYLTGRLVGSHRPPRSCVVWLLFALMVAAVAWRTDRETFSIDFSEMDDEGLNYLAIADQFALWALLALACAARRRWLLVTLLLPSAAALFVIGSRSSLYAFLISIIVLGFVLAPKRSIALAAVAGAALTAIIGQDISNVEDLGRMFALANLASDPSYIERAEQRAVAFERIAAHPIAGDYGGTIRDFSSLGAYTHDITSYWQHLGLMPFTLVILLLGLTALAFYQSVRRIRTNGLPGTFDAFLVLYFPFVVVQVVFSRAYDWPFVWMLFGISVSKLSDRVEISASRFGSRAFSVGRSGTRSKNPRPAASINNRAKPN